MINSSRSNDQHGSRLHRKQHVITTAITLRPKSQIRKTGTRYDELKSLLHRWLEDRFKAAEALKEIHAQRLYKAEYPNFDQFCENELGYSRAHAYRLLDAVEGKEVIVSHAGDKSVTSLRQASEVGRLPKAERERVVKRVAKTGAVTAKAIREAAGKSEVIDAEIVVSEPKPRVHDCPMCRC